MLLPWTIRSRTSETPELALARLADRLLQAGDADSLPMKIRGRLLRLYMELRSSDVLRFRKLRRLQLRPLVRKLARAAFEADVRRAHAEREANWQSKYETFEEELRQWNQERAKRSWIQRFSIRPEPQMPAKPYPLSAVIANLSPAKASPELASELLVEFAATFELPVLPAEPEDIREADVKLLAG